MSTPSLWHWFFSKNSSGPDRKARWDWLRHGVIPDLADQAILCGHWEVGYRWVSEDARVTKFRLRSWDHGDACETVVMRPRPVRGTVCISTQVGCGVGCVFCATGRMGGFRNLTATEILEQVLIAKHEVHGGTRRLSGPSICAMWC